MSSRRFLLIVAPEAEAFRLFFLYTQHFQFKHLTTLLFYLLFRRGNLTFQARALGSNNFYAK